jgi:GNAT superfamily N-acetyltransferase
MPLTLHQISSTKPADIALIPAISRIHLSAWLTNSLYKAIYYGPSSSYPGIIEANRQRHFRSFTTNPSTRFALVVDDEVESNQKDSILENKEQRIKPSQVIAWVKYDIFESSQAAEDRKDTGERIWPSYTNLAIVANFWDLIVASRQRQSKEIGPHISVDLLATDPKHHRRGAGRMLMQHVVNKADELGLVATIEGSPEGASLYSSVGFVPVDEFWVDILRFAGGNDKGEDWVKTQGRVPGNGEGWYKQLVMIRQPVVQ